MKKSDPFDLNRFVEAQEGVYAGVLAELRAGDKRGHWIWFIFPQIAGLGASPMARRYAIQSRDEAVAYLAHPILGERLRECVEAMNSNEGSDAEEILGGIDAMKFRSSLTLFAQVADDPSVFEDALDKYYDGDQDPLTMGLLEDA
ncbi:DUF1810 domain-containing protein [candidate division BRC1 bacterium HGW-BRC1-1]|jgi:uncharacterized protein (DUF1810 family)|nr:MAG: DUF1810 domain-containing protein [candidate division BRC1 bacterium HGW-BRC1-1]